MNDSERKQFLGSFIINNHDFAIKYLKSFFDVHKSEDWKELIRFLFIAALNSDGRIGNIRNKALSIESLEKITEGMQEQSYAELIRVFNVSDYNGLFKSIDDFPQIGPKKAALFLRDILYLRKVILNVPPEVYATLKVPVDRVIVRTINSIFDKTYKENNDETFKAINELARDIFADEPILMEDLWFWGRFYRCEEDNKKDDLPYCSFNDALLTIDSNVSKEYRDELFKYEKSNRDCPFRDICIKKALNEKK